NPRQRQLPGAVVEPRGGGRREQQRTCDGPPGEGHVVPGAPRVLAPRKPPFPRIAPCVPSLESPGRATERVPRPKDHCHSARPDPKVDPVETTIVRRRNPLPAPPDGGDPHRRHGNACTEPAPLHHLPNSRPTLHAQENTRDRRPSCARKLS